MYRPQQTHKKTAGDLEKELADLYAGPKQDVNRAVEHYKASSDTYLESESDLTAYVPPHLADSWISRY